MTANGFMIVNLNSVGSFEFLHIFLAKRNNWLNIKHSQNLIAEPKTWLRNNPKFSRKELRDLDKFLSESSYYSGGLPKKKLVVILNNGHCQIWSQSMAYFFSGRPSEQLCIYVYCQWVHKECLLRYFLVKLHPDNNFRQCGAIREPVSKVNLTQSRCRSLIGSFRSLFHDQVCRDVRQIDSFWLKIWNLWV